MTRDNSCLLTEDLCIIEARDYFIRGVIHIPVHGTDEGFGWGVWVSQKKEHFETYREYFDSADIGPYFGWLCTSISYYEAPTLSLKTTAHFRSNNQRPGIVLHQQDHPLYYQQRDGITLEEAWRIVHHYKRPKH